MLKKTITYLESHLALAYGTKQSAIHTTFYRRFVPPGHEFQDIFIASLPMEMCRQAQNVGKKLCILRYLPSRTGRNKPAVPSSYRRFVPAGHKLSMYRLVHERGKI